jgi:hypothetical protein
LVGALPDCDAASVAMNAPVSGRSWNILSGLWMAGAAVSLAVALLPVRFVFLEETAVLGPITLDMISHALTFAWYAVWMPMIFTSRLGVALATFGVFQGGVVIEFLQMHIPYHRFSETDILSNGVGCLVGLGVGIVLRRNWKAARD